MERKLVHIEEGPAQQAGEAEISWEVDGDRDTQVTPSQSGCAEQESQEVPGEAESPKSCFGLVQQEKHSPKS